MMPTDRFGGFAQFLQTNGEMIILKRSKTITTYCSLSYSRHAPL